MILHVHNTQCRIYYVLCMLIIYWLKPRESTVYSLEIHVKTYCPVITILQNTDYRPQYIIKYTLSYKHYILHYTHIKEEKHFCFYSLTYSVCLSILDSLSTIFFVFFFCYHYYYFFSSICYYTTTRERERERTKHVSRIEDLPLHLFYCVIHKNKNTEKKK